MDFQKRLTELGTFENFLAKNKVYWGVMNGTFWVANNKLEVIGKVHGCFDKKGEYTKAVYTLAKKYHIDVTKYAEMRTENSIDDVKAHLKAEYDLVHKYLTRQAKVQSELK